MSSQIYSGGLAAKGDPGDRSPIYRVDRTPDGTIWALVMESASTLEFFYSQDNGATWHDSGISVGVTNMTGAAFFIDAAGVGHVLYCDTVPELYYQRVTFAGTVVTPGTRTNVDGGATALNGISIVAHADPQGSTDAIVHVAYNITISGTNYVRWHYLRSHTDGTATAVMLLNLASLATGPSGYTGVPTAIDFRHTGDGKTVAAATPDVYVAYYPVWQTNPISTDDSFRFIRLPYANGSWSANTSNTRTYASQAGAGIQAIYWSAGFDGTRFNIGWIDNLNGAGNRPVYLISRDAADTTWTSAATGPTFTGGMTLKSGLTFVSDAIGDVYAHLIDGANGVKRLHYERASNAWRPVVLVDATTTAVWVGGRRGNGSGSGGTVADVLYVTGTNPYVTDFATLGVNAAPNAASWLTTTGQASDVANALELDWAFNDPDPSDAQSAYAISRQIGTGTVQYYQASDGTWQAAEVENASSVETLALPAGWGSAADGNHVYKVKTWDRQGAASPYSAALTVVPSAKVDPVITAPVSGSTIDTSVVLLSWTCSDQSAYRVRVLIGATVSSDTGWIPNGTQSLNVQGLVNTTTFTLEVTTKNADGLASDAVTVSVTTAYTAPAVPTCFAMIDTPVKGAVRLGQISPAPSGSQPTVSSWDLYRINNLTGEVKRIGRDLDPAATVDCYTVGSGIDYAFQAVVFGVNGTSTASIWAE